MKILIAYYSRTGNTKFVAEEIQKAVGGDLVEIVPEKAYSDSYVVAIAQAKIDKMKNARPALSTPAVNVAEYDLIFLGYPNWWGSYPMLIASFADNNGLNGKHLAPFFTNGGGGLQNCEKDLQAYLPQADFEKCLVLNSKKGLQDKVAEIAAWAQACVK